MLLKTGKKPAGESDRFYSMTPAQEVEFEAKAEKMLKGHRSSPDGRDYRAFYQSNITDEQRNNYRLNFDRIFPNAPGAGY